jgi:enoyl-CoA hydratase/carnithine racemase
VYSNILVNEDGRVATIVFNRPLVLNALSKALKEELADALRQIAGNRDVRAIVLTGAGKAFSAGQDLNEAKDLDGAGAAEWVREYQRLYQQIRSLEKPIIAAVNGWCVGAGCQIALLADIRLASSSARFAMPEIKDGIPAIFGLSFLANVIGISRSIHLVLTGESLSAAEALAAGLVSRVFPPGRLLKEAKSLAQRLTEYAPLAIRLDKQWARRLSDQAFHATVEFCVEAQREAFASGDAKKEMEAFLGGARKKAIRGKGKRK